MVLLFKIIFQGFVARVFRRALINTRRCCFPGVGKITASLARRGTGALSARDTIQDIPPPPREKGVLQVHQCFPKRFGWLVGDGEAVGL